MIVSVAILILPEEKDQASMGIKPMPPAADALTTAELQTVQPPEGFKSE